MSNFESNVNIVTRCRKVMVNSKEIREMLESVLEFNKQRKSLMKKRKSDALITVMYRTKITMKDYKLSRKAVKEYISHNKNLDYEQLKYLKEFLEYVNSLTNKSNLCNDF